MVLHLNQVALDDHNMLKILQEYFLYTEGKF